MLILIYIIAKNNLVPVIGAILTATIDAMMPIVILCAGIAIMLSAVGIRAGGFFGTIANGVVRGIGYICRTIISAIGWCLRHLILFIPAFYIGVRNSLRRNGSNEIITNLVSFLATLLLIGIII